MLLFEHVAYFPEDFERGEVSLFEFLKEVVRALGHGEDVFDDEDVVDVDHVGEFADELLFDGFADEVFSDEEQLEVGEDGFCDRRIVDAAELDVGESSVFEVHVLLGRDVCEGVVFEDLEDEQPVVFLEDVRYRAAVQSADWLVNRPYL